MRRRDFLRHLGAGSALACLPFGLRESFAASMNLPDLVITEVEVLRTFGEEPTLASLVRRRDELIALLRDALVPAGA